MYCWFVFESVCGVRHVFSVCVVVVFWDVCGLCVRCRWLWVVGVWYVRFVI